MFDYNEIKRNFCDPWSDKKNIKYAPFKRDEFIYATNGRIGIRVKIENVENIPEDIETRTDSYSDTLKNFFANCNDSLSTYSYNFMENYLKLATEEECVGCHGSGKEDLICECCEGDGKVDVEVECPHCSDKWEVRVECHKCEGEGTIRANRGHGEPCSCCEGTGKQFSIKVSDSFKISNTCIMALRTLNDVLLNMTLQKEQYTTNINFIFKDKAGICDGFGVFVLTRTN